MMQALTQTVGLAAVKRRFFGAGIGLFVNSGSMSFRRTERRGIEHRDIDELNCHKDASDQPCQMFFHAAARSRIRLVIWTAQSVDCARIQQDRGYACDTGPIADIISGPGQEASAKLSGVFPALPAYVTSRGLHRFVSTSLIVPLPALLI